MIEFILNNKLIRTNEAGGSSLLDFIRTVEHLKGTKIGCREGDCGACTVLQGGFRGEDLIYKAIVSCLTPLANVNAKHIVTIEGLNQDHLSPIQQSIVAHGATQCGFCTPGFVVALTGHLLSDKKENAKQAISGNICRCTGYKSIERAAHEVDEAKQTLLKGDEISSMIEKKWLPDYFSDIRKRLSLILIANEKSEGGIIIAGGTDLMVQQADVIREKYNTYIKTTIPKSIELTDGKIVIGAGITISDFFENKMIQTYFPMLQTAYPLIASGQIRNMGTLAGNFVNASPIGDMSILFLALNAHLVFSSQRKLPIKDFYLDYKKTDLRKDELIHSIEISKHLFDYKMNFEKVSKRTYLDIASVNTALSIKLDGDRIQDVLFSVGGVAAYPKLMAQTCFYLIGKALSLDTLENALEIIQAEISPISDIRGSKAYKRLLIRQLFLQHFLKLFPNDFEQSSILKLMNTNTFSE
ncbi:MAG: FAD binding domain-containing protein [Bacteroidales bacterium]|nr:FAD binding domain-containing protein [Bacteroidales bacterium]